MKNQTWLSIFFLLLVLTPSLSAYGGYYNSPYGYYNDYTTWDYPYRYQNEGYWEWHPYTTAYNYYPYSRYQRYDYDDYYPHPKYYYHPWRWSHDRYRYDDDD